MITEHTPRDIPEEELWETVNIQLFMREIKQHEETQETLLRAKIDFADRILEIEWDERLLQESIKFQRIVRDILAK